MALKKYQWIATATSNAVVKTKQFKDFGNNWLNYGLCQLKMAVSLTQHFNGFKTKERRKRVIEQQESGSGKGN